MRKTLTGLFLLAAVASIPTPASAAITWSMSDGVNTKTSALPPTGFASSLSAPAGANQTLNLLVCTTPPCTRGFPSGSATPLSTDTFKIVDIASTNRARIEKTDVPVGGTATTGADSVVLRGIKVFALSAG